MRTMNMTLSALAAAAALTVALVWSATAAPGSTAARNSGASTAAASGADTYSIFASSTSRLDATKPGWRPPAELVGARMAEARLISQDSTRTVVAVPAAKAPCLISRFADGSQSVSCALEADEQPASVSSSGAIGLVPDAVESVTLTMTEGTARVVPVDNNVWTAPDDAAQAAYSLGGRFVKVQLMPRSSMPPGDTTDPSQAPSRGPDAAG